VPDRIIIDLDDESKKDDRKESERIVIDFGSKEEKIEVGEIEESHEKKILKSKFNSFYRGNTGLSGYFESSLKFPEGIEQGFRTKYGIELEDTFLNSILENNRYIILTSVKGKVYFIDRFTGKLNESIYLENEIFEKTGVVVDNTVYLNSLKKIFEFSKTGISKKEIFSAEENYFIWSNLNRFGNRLVFVLYEPVSGRAFFKTLRLSENFTGYEYGFTSEKFLGSSVCIAYGRAYVLFDGKLLEYNFEKQTGGIFDPGIETDLNSIIFYSNGKLYITSAMNELYYLELPAANYKFKFTGIKDPYMNSAGGFGDNLFTGTIDGWNFYKSGGMRVYRYDDESENKIECISKNILVVSQKNKIVFCNLNRFQEAESIVMTSTAEDSSAEIVSAAVSGNEIAVLTSNGLLKVFTNDKLNIHI